MVKKSLYSMILILLLAASSAARSNETYFKFYLQDRADLPKITRLISIDNIKNDTVFAYANEDEFAQFKTLGYDYAVLPHPGSLYKPTGRVSTTNWDTYPSYDEYVDSMYNYEIEYPGLCRIYNIGYSVEGRQILFAKISANVDIEENEPEAMYSSTMHGDETTGYILMLRLIEYLLDNYGINSQVTNLVDNMEIWINPLANPDGTYAGGDSAIINPTRYNANSKDLNRNFPDPGAGPHPDGYPWQPETIAMMNFFDQHNFIISANFHGGAEVVNYPWDTWSRAHADESWYIQICREYADSAQANSPSGYMTDLDNGITNGYDWYEVDGGRQDYLNYWKGCRETTIELSHTHFLPESQLNAHWNYNKMALITYLEQAFYGIRGLVTDALTAEPVAATISVLSHDIDSSEVYADSAIGDYHRMIDGGTWNLRFTAYGYYPQTLSGITASDRNITYASIQLQPTPTSLGFLAHDAGFVHAGDTVSMTITLINEGGIAATGVSATLAASDSYADIIQAASTYLNIAGAGGTAISDNEYVFAISESCPDNHQLNFRLDIAADGGYVDSAFFSMIVGLVVEDFETGDFSSFPWSMAGAASWFITSSEAYENTYSARSGYITHNQSSIIYLDYEVSAPGTISFYYKVSSESDYDFLKFYIDSDRQDQWSGTVDWTQASYSVGAGPHVFKWEYYKDRSLSHGSDCAWIDYIIFPPIGVMLEITTASLPDWTINRPYSVQLEATGGTGNLAWSDLNNNLVGTGLALSSDGLLSGTPSTAGQINFTARVTDEASHYDDAPFSFTINPGIEITSQTLPDWTIGQVYAQQLQASGGTGNLTWTDYDNGLSGSGLNLSGEGLISGVPLAAGAINFIVRATDGTGAFDDQPLSFAINPAIEITSDSLPDAYSDIAYNYQLESTGGTGDKIWIDRDNDLDGSGLILSISGLISGTPEPLDSIVFTARVSDIAGDSDERQFIIFINSESPFVPGDANGDGRVIGSDITYLVNYLRGIGGPPDPLLAGDANGDCFVIGSDVTYLLAYFRGNGDPPRMGDCDGIIPGY